jgi:uncharacterized membrane protein
MKDMKEIMPESAPPIAASSPVRISWPHLILGNIGLALSAYSLYVHGLIKKGEDSGCGFSNTINCDKVLASRYGEFLSIPLGVWGMVFFVIVILTAVTSKGSTTTVKQTAGWQLAVAAAGFITSVALIYISKVLIGAFCPICMATHATTTLLFLASLYTYSKAQWGSPETV